MTLCNGNLRSSEFANSVVARDAVDILKLAKARRVVLNLILRVFKLFDKKSEGAINDLCIKLWI
jgi:hypothetical protein